jgi:hypothetical protein
MVFGGDCPSGGGSVIWTGQTSALNTSCGFVTTCSISSLTVTGGFVVVGVGGQNNAGGASTISSVSVWQLSARRRKPPEGKMRSPGAPQIRNTFACAKAGTLSFRRESQAAVPAEQDTPRTSPNHSQLATQTASRWGLVSLRLKPAFHLRTRTNGWDHLQDWAASRSNLHLNPAGNWAGRGRTVVGYRGNLAPDKRTAGYGGYGCSTTYRLAEMHQPKRADEQRKASSLIGNHDEQRGMSR